MVEKWHVHQVGADYLDLSWDTIGLLAHRATRCSRFCSATLSQNLLTDFLLTSYLAYLQLCAF